MCTPGPPASWWLRKELACRPRGEPSAHRNPASGAQIELKLLNEVSTKSEGFFEALESYERLTREVAEGCLQIESLRERMRTLEANLVLKSMRLPRLARRRVHTAALLNKLRLMHAVWRTQPTIQQLLTARDFPGALELISSSQQLLNTGALMPPRRKLRSRGRLVQSCAWSPSPGKRMRLPSLLQQRPRFVHTNAITAEQTTPGPARVDLCALVPQNLTA